jgi:hypothetical protein
LSFAHQWLYTNASGAAVEMCGGAAGGGTPLRVLLLALLVAVQLAQPLSGNDAGDTTGEPRVTEGYRVSQEQNLHARQVHRGVLPATHSP